jgi:hypothetical protein
MAKKRRTTRARRYFTKAVHHAKKMTLPLAVIAGLLPGVAVTATAVKNSGWMMGTRVLGLSYTGFDYQTGTFSLNSMKSGLLPLFIGTLVHKAAGMLGINRAIAGAGIPIIRI